MEQLNIFSFNEEVFTDCNGNGPYDNLFKSLKRFTNEQELPKKYTVNNRVFKVIDADKNDYLGITNEQVIFGLRFKYKARDNKQTRLNKLNKAILNGFCRIA